MRLARGERDAPPPPPPPDGDLHRRGRRRRISRRRRRRDGGGRPPPPPQMGRRPSPVRQSQSAAAHERAFKLFERRLAAAQEGSLRLADVPLPPPGAVCSARTASARKSRPRGPPALASRQVRPVEDGRQRMRAAALERLRLCRCHAAGRQGEKERPAMATRVIFQRRVGRQVAAHASSRRANRGSTWFSFDVASLPSCGTLKTCGRGRPCVIA